MTTKPIRRILPVLYHYAAGGRVAGPNPNMRGNCSDLSGNCTDLSGDCSGLWGDCSDLSGDLDAIPLDARPCDLSDWTEDMA